MMGLYDTLKFMYPDANMMFDIVLEDRGGVAVLARWNRPEPRPTQAQIDAAAPLAQAALIAASARNNKDVADASAAKMNAKLEALASMSPAQVQAWVSANVGNLGEAKDLLSTLAIAVSILARRL